MLLDFFDSHNCDDSSDDDLALWGTEKQSSSSRARPPMRASNDEDDEASVSTAELARIIRGNAAPAKSNRPSTSGVGPTTASRGAPGMTIAVSTIDPTRTIQTDDSTSRSKIDAKSTNDRGGENSSPKARFSLARVNSTTPKKNPFIPAPQQEPKDDYSDDEDYFGATNDPSGDDDASVSTAELARRIRGEPPKAKSQHSRVSTNPPQASNQKSCPLPMDAADENRENMREPRDNVYPKIETGGDFYLPSPLPSSDDEASSSDDEKDGVPDNVDGIASKYHAAIDPHWQSEKAAENNKESGDNLVESIVENRAQAKPIVREGLRSSPGPWAKQRRLNATGALFANQPSWSHAMRRSLTRTDLEEDIEAFSDEEQAALPRVSVGSSAKVRTKRSSVRHVTDPTMAANVLGGFPPSWNTAAAPPRNDLTGGSGVGQNIAGQYQMFSQPPPATRPARGGRGRKRSSTRQGGGGRGRGRRRASSRGRGRGRGRGGRGRDRGISSGGGGGAAFPQQGNAWSDYPAQSTAWASNSQSSNLGNVGGAEISF